MKYRIARAALADLESIDDYTVKKWGADQADRYLSMLWSTFERISQSPTRWRLRPEIHLDCRICIAGRHAILFRIRGDSIEIARVLHEAMDFPRHTKKLFSEF